MSIDATESTSMKKDLGYYMVLWLVFGAIGGITTPVIPPNSDGVMAADYFWGVKLQQLLLGFMFGSVCGLAFTFVQNTLNNDRNKKVTWGIAIAIWLGVKLAIMGISLIVS